MLALLLASSPAQAEPNGLKFGDGRLHPSFDFESRYDSAAAMVYNPKSNNYDIPGDMVLHFRPGLKLDVPSPAFAVSLNGTLDYVLYTGASLPGTTAASHLEADANLNLGFNKEGQVSFELGDHISRSDQIQNMSVIQVGALALYNDASAKLSIKPSGGALSLEPSYNLTSEFFQGLNGGIKLSTCKDGDSSCDPKSLNAFDYLNHTFGLTGSWRFLPKTAFLIDANYGVRTYTDTRSTDINTLKLEGGLAGLLTTHVSTILKAGWGWDTTKHSYSSMVAQAELAYLLSETGSIRLGYLRTFDPIGGETFLSYRDDRPYAELSLLLGGKFTLHGRATVDLLTYRAKDPAKNNGNRTEKQTALGAEIGGDYEFATWLDVGLGLISTFRSGDQPVYLGNKQFTRSEYFLHVKATY